MSLLPSGVKIHVALGVTEIITDLTFYNYEAKYAAGGSRHVDFMA